MRTMTKKIWNTFFKIKQQGGKSIILWDCEKEKISKLKNVSRS